MSHHFAPGLAPLSLFHGLLDRCWTGLSLTRDQGSMMIFAADSVHRLNTGRPLCSEAPVAGLTAPPHYRSMVAALPDGDTPLDAQALINAAPRTRPLSQTARLRLAPLLDSALLAYGGMSAEALHRKISARSVALRGVRSLPGFTDHAVRPLDPQRILADAAAFNTEMAMPF